MKTNKKNLNIILFLSLLLSTLLLIACSSEPLALAVLDTVDPVISDCPVDQVVPLTAGNESVAVTWVIPTATDDQGEPRFRTTHGPDDLFSPGSTTVTYTFFDAGGNFAECSFDIVVTSVSIEGCPDDQTVNTAASLATAEVTWTAPTARDLADDATDDPDANIILASSSPTKMSPASFSIGDTSLTYTFSDSTGYEDSCTFTITVIDAEAPVVTCPADANATAEISAPDIPMTTAGTVTWTEPTATDNSDSDPILTAQSHTSGTSLFPGSSTLDGTMTTAVTYTFTDGSGNEGACSFLVTVTTEDTTPPVIATCPETTNVLVEGAATEATFGWVSPTATDNSGDEPTFTTPTNQKVSGDTFTIAASPTTLTYTFTDGSGNTADCSFDVIVTSIIVMACPDDQTLSTTGGSTVSATWSPPTGSDPSGDTVTVMLTSGLMPGASFPIGATDVSYTLSTIARTASCTFTITIIDIDPPVVTCPTDIHATAEISSPDIPMTTVTWTEPTATDNSGSATISAQSHTSGTSRFPGSTTLGSSETTTVTYTFTDDAGNTADCSFDVIVTTVDTTAPVGTCPADVSRDAPANSATVTATWTVPTATDNSGAVPSPSSTHTSGTAFPIGPTTVTVTFTDGTSNTATCAFTVTVTDRVAPVISACDDQTFTVAEPADGTATITWVLPTATDNSGFTPPISGPSYQNKNLPKGVKSVTYTFTDGSGNVATCTFDVTVFFIKKVFLLTGQSNTLGKGNRDSGLRAPLKTDAGFDTLGTTPFWHVAVTVNHEKANWDKHFAGGTQLDPFEYGSRSTNAGNKTKQVWLPGVVYQPHKSNTGITYWSTEFSIARTVSSNHHDFALIKIVRGGGGNGYWIKTSDRPTNRSSHMWKNIVTNILRAGVAMEEDHLSMQVVAVGWVQGESNRPLEDGDAATAGTLLINFINNLASDTLISKYVPGVPFLVIGEFGTGNPARRSDELKKVARVGIAAQKKIAADNAHITFAKANDLQRVTSVIVKLSDNNIHFNHEGRLILGERMAERLLTTSTSPYYKSSYTPRDSFIWQAVSSTSTAQKREYCALFPSKWNHGTNCSNL